MIHRGAPKGTTADVWYFAYGSNMETATLGGRRGIEFTRAHAARVAGWRLTIDKPGLVSIGESYANLIADPAGEVLGVVYNVNADGLERIGRSEGVPVGNYCFVDVDATPLSAARPPVVAATLVSEHRNPRLRPSRRYMARVIAGAEEHGLPAEYVAYLRSVPTGEESAASRALGRLLDRLLRRLAQAR